MMTEANMPAITVNPGNPPMPFGATLERVYRILRDHTKVFLGIAAPPAVAMMVLYGVMFGVMFNTLRPYLSTSTTPLAAAGAQFAMMRIMFPSIMVAIVPVTVILAFYLWSAFFAANKIDSGVGTTVGECFGEAWGRMGRSLGLFLWIYLRAFGPVLVLEIALFGVSGWYAFDETLLNTPVETLALLPLLWLLLIAASVYGIVVGLRMSLAFPASIEEGLTAGDAIRRSSLLTQGSKGRIFLLLLVMELIGCACMIVLEIVIGVVFGIGSLVFYLVPAHSASGWTILGILVGVIAGIGLLFLFYVWTALLYASLVVTLSVVYHDQRRRMDAAVFGGEARLTPGAAAAETS